MARASTAAENRAISGTFAATTPTPSTTAYWMSLHTGDPGTSGATPVTHIGIWDAVTAGNFVIGAALSPSSVTATSIQFAIGQASFSAT